MIFWWTWKRIHSLNGLKNTLIPEVSHEEMKRIAPRVMEDAARFKAELVRDEFRERGLLTKNIVRYYYRPFDVRWLYWEAETKLLDEKRAEYFLASICGQFMAGSSSTKSQRVQSANCHNRLLLSPYYRTRRESISALAQAKPRPFVII